MLSVDSSHDQCQIVGGGVLWTLRANPAPPSHLADGFSRLLTEGRGGEVLEQSCDTLEPPRATAGAWAAAAVASAGPTYGAFLEAEPWAQCPYLCNGQARQTALCAPSRASVLKLRFPPSLLSEWPEPCPA